MNVNVLRDCTDEQVLYCIAGTFPAIDFFQVTVGETHSVLLSAMAKICAIMKACGQRQVNLFFLVPPARFDSWTSVQSYKGHLEEAEDEQERKRRLRLDPPVVQCALTYNIPEHK